MSDYKRASCTGHEVTVVAVLQYNNTNRSRRESPTWDIIGSAEDRLHLRALVAAW